MNDSYLHILDKFSSKSILVIGDFILDVYLKGTSSRLSPEAPVPVVEVKEKVEVPGGAANTAMNLKALGADVTFLSVVGFDDEGSKAKTILQKAGINTTWLVRAINRTTIVKTRLLSGNHVISRFDSGNEDQIDEASERNLIRHMSREFQKYDAVVVSDYGKGVITSAVRDELARLRSNSKRFLAVDSKRLAFFQPVRPCLVKPNYEEVLALTGLQRQLRDRRAQIASSGATLFAATHAEIVAASLDAEGALIFRNGELVHEACSDVVGTPNVVGAGDTFISAYTLSRISGGSDEASADLACKAASVAVKKEGTASCVLNELRACYLREKKYITSIVELENLAAMYKAEGKKIVFTNGCFDILHSGHVSYLNRARQLGDILIVGVNNDDSIRRLKGQNRPINPIDDRIKVLAGLTAIDHLISFGSDTDDTPIPLIKAVKPQVFVKGGDYTREALPEAATVEEFGGEIILLSLVKDHSTTRIIQQIYKTSTLAVA